MSHRTCGKFWAWTNEGCGYRCFQSRYLETRLRLDSFWDFWFFLDFTIAVVKYIPSIDHAVIFLCAGLAMPNNGNKRMRSLASKLWCDSDCEEDDPLLETTLSRSQCASSGCVHSQSQRGQGQSKHFALQNTVAELREKLARVTLQLFEVQKYVVPLAGQPGLRSPWTSTSWLEDNEHLLELPRMKSFLLQWETCNCGTEIVFSLCKQQSMTASRVLKHCEWVICNLFKQTPAVYKIGITENPIDRWMGKSYSYKWDPTDDWEQMVILFVGADSMHCALVEAHLIQRFCGRSGCRNVRPGGESAKPGPGPFYTYVVWRNLAYPKKNDTIHQML